MCHGAGAAGCRSGCRAGPEEGPQRALRGRRGALGCERARAHAAAIAAAMAMARVCARACAHARRGPRGGPAAATEPLGMAMLRYATEPVRACACARACAAVRVPLLPVRDGACACPQREAAGMCKAGFKFARAIRLSPCLGLPGFGLSKARRAGQHRAVCWRHRP